MISDSTTTNNPAAIQVKTWTWRKFPITYATAGEGSIAVIFIHGFGAAWQHWRKNLPVLGKFCRCYGIDLIGFGGSAKPTPGQEIDYTFNTWGEQVADFCQQVVGTPAYLVGNSIGCIVAMQTAVDHPELVLGIAAINCSLRLLHERKLAQLPWYRRLGAPLLQKLLSNKLIGYLFFRQLAQPKVIKKILLQAYKRSEAVTDELVNILIKPTQDPGAADVFLAFIGYSQGPLAEDLLPKLQCKIIFLWGTDDPWEPIELGRQLANFSSVEDFIPLPGLGHCPQDEAPEIVNPILEEWIKKKTEH